MGPKGNIVDTQGSEKWTAIQMAKTQYSTQSGPDQESFKRKQTISLIIGMFVVAGIIWWTISTWQSNRARQMAPIVSSRPPTSASNKVRPQIGSGAESSASR